MRTLFGLFVCHINGLRRIPLRVICHMEQMSETSLTKVYFIVRGAVVDS
jgi:hypothetical protein